MGTESNHAWPDEDNSKMAYLRQKKLLYVDRQRPVLYVKSTVLRRFPTETGEIGSEKMKLGKIFTHTNLINID